MFETPINQKTVICRLKRIEVCDLLIACTAIANAVMDSGETGKKWEELHTKLEKILGEWDQKQECSHE